MMTLKNKIKKSKPVDLSEKNHIITISLFDNKDGTMHGQFHVTSAYFDEDASKLNRIIGNTINTLKNQLIKENVILMSTIH